MEVIYILRYDRQQFPHIFQPPDGHVGTIGFCIPYCSIHFRADFPVLFAGILVRHEILKIKIGRVVSIPHAPGASESGMQESVLSPAPE